MSQWLKRRSWAPATVAALPYAWLRLSAATSRWDRHGEAELELALRDGPVILALWHERIALPGYHWRKEWGPISALHSARLSGRAAGWVQAAFGMQPVAMSSHGGNLAASREVLRRLQAGTSVGIAVDGSSGPARVVKDAVLDWARVSGRPVFVYAFAQRGAWRLDTWDRSVWPRPLAPGVAIWRRWARDVPRRADAREMAVLRADLARALSAVADDADALVRPRG